MAENSSTGWTGGKNAFGDFAPGMVHYTDKVLFDQVWEREGLSKRDRSLVTVAALTALGKTEQLKFHLGFALKNGVTADELKEALLHLAFYSGWPNRMGAMSVLKGIIEEESPVRRRTGPERPADREHPAPMTIRHEGNAASGLAVRVQPTTHGSIERFRGLDET